MATAGWDLATHSLLLPRRSASPCAEGLSVIHDPDKCEPCFCLEEPYSRCLSEDRSPDDDQCCIFHLCQSTGLK